MNPQAKKSKQFPAFLFYPEDFAAGTADMAPLEVGVYIRCLCHQWSKGVIPDDPVKVGRISGATPDEMALAWPAVKSKFKAAGEGLLANTRLEEVRRKLVASSKKRAASGRAGAVARWGHGELFGEDDSEGVGISNGKAIANASQSNSETMASCVGNENDLGTGFDSFWEIWPRLRRKSKGAALKAWCKAREKVSAESLIEAAREYSQSREGQGDFVKMPSTWLNQECWADDRQAWSLNGSVNGHTKKTREQEIAELAAR